VVFTRSAIGPVVFAIHFDALGFGQLPAQDTVDEILQIVEPFAIPADDCRALGRVDLEAGSVVGFLHLDRCRKAEMAEHCIEDFRR
jgi:hypothetical protein